jgi:hypothetical protein
MVTGGVCPGSVAHAANSHGIDAILMGSPFSGTHSEARSRVVILISDLIAPHGASM